MAEKDGREEQEEQGKKKKGSKLKWILLAAVIIVLGTGGFLGYNYFLADKNEDGNATKTEGTAAKSKEKKNLDSQVVSLPSFIVNLADPLGRRYLKVSIDVEVVSEAAAQKLEDSMPKVKDALLLLLSSKSFSEVNTMEEKLQLKSQIVSRLNQILDESLVIKVYFTEFVVQ
ncbi:MAG: flagellar basal body-associated FliL family protein [Thermodesulfobacteriota bacterium]